MPRQRVKFGGRVAFITYQLDWKPGDLPPTDKSDYLGWHEWAEVQHKAGLRQRRCWKCGLWRFPQEVCCGAEPPGMDHGFTIDDVLSGKAPWPAGIPRKRKAAK